MMNVGDDGNRGTRNYLGKTFSGFYLVTRASHDVATRRGKCINLLQRAFNIGSLRGGH